MKRKTKVDMPTLDLHGAAKNDVIDAVDRFLMKCQHQGAPKARLITGRGTGVVRGEALAWLKRGGYPYSKENEGSFIIYFDE